MSTRQNQGLVDRIARDVVTRVGATVIVRDDKRWIVVQGVEHAVNAGCLDAHPLLLGEAIAAVKSLKPETLGRIVYIARPHHGQSGPRLTSLYEAWPPGWLLSTMWSGKEILQQLAVTAVIARAWDLLCADHQEHVSDLDDADPSIVP